MVMNNKVVDPTYSMLLRHPWLWNTTSRNIVVCNHSLCDYVWLNVTYDYKWLLMWLFFKFGWILVFFSTSCNYDLFHHFNRWFFMMSLYILKYHIYVYLHTFIDIYVPRAFQWYKELPNLMGFDPCNRSLKIRESTGTPIPKMGAHLGVEVFILSHSPTLSTSQEHKMWLLGFTLGSHPCKPLPWSRAQG
jgi:hypothetical protein